MPNPPFTPLTLSVEEWQKLRSTDLYFVPTKQDAIYKELEAQWYRICEQKDEIARLLQEAASLRQRLEDERAEFAVKLEQARMEPSGGYLLANAQAEAHILRQRLEEALKSYETLGMAASKATDEKLALAAQVEIWQRDAKRTERAAQKIGQECAMHQNKLTWAGDHVKALEARASQAEAALEEMKKWIEDDIRMAAKHPSQKIREQAMRLALAELQRRRSPTAG